MTEPNPWGKMVAKRTSWISLSRLFLRVIEQSKREDRLAIEVLHDLGYHVNSRNEKGMDLLECSIERGEEGFIKRYLLADPNLRVSDTFFSRPSLFRFLHDVQMIKDFFTHPQGNPRSTVKSCPLNLLELFCVHMRDPSVLRKVLRWMATSSWKIKLPDLFLAHLLNGPLQNLSFGEDDQPSEEMREGAALSLLEQGFLLVHLPLPPPSESLDRVFPFVACCATGSDLCKHAQRFFTLERKRILEILERCVDQQWAGPLEVPFNYARKIPGSQILRRFIQLIPEGFDDLLEESQLFFHLNLKIDKEQQLFWGGLSGQLTRNSARREDLLSMLWDCLTHETITCWKLFPRQMLAMMDVIPETFSEAFSTLLIKGCKFGHPSDLSQFVRWGRDRQLPLQPPLSNERREKQLRLLYQDIHNCQLTSCQVSMIMEHWPRFLPPLGRISDCSPGYFDHYLSQVGVCALGDCGFDPIFRAGNLKFAFSGTYAEQVLHHHRSNTAGKYLVVALVKHGFLDFHPCCQPYLSRQGNQAPEARDRDWFTPRLARCLRFLTVVQRLPLELQMLICSFSLPLPSQNLILNGVEQKKWVVPFFITLDLLPVSWTLLSRLGEGK